MSQSLGNSTLQKLLWMPLDLNGLFLPAFHTWSCYVAITAHYHVKWLLLYMLLARLINRQDVVFDE